MPVSVYPKSEILFPPRLIPELKDLRGPEWRDLVTRVAELPETHPDSLAFSLLMIRLNGCLKCTNGSYKFMRGCAACSRQTIMQFKGSDADLLRLYQRAQAEVNRYLAETGQLEQAA
ncbi:MAG: hypothetical protein GXP39_16225 [Chloroflexi bacterium]|nr:hypothetical protein [Chloroflexota bacterium]